MANKTPNGTGVVISNAAPSIEASFSPQGEKKDFYRATIGGRVCILTVWTKTAGKEIEKAQLSEDVWKEHAEMISKIYENQLKDTDDFKNLVNKDFFITDGDKPKIYYANANNSKDLTSHEINIEKADTVFQNYFSNFNKKLRKGEEEPVLEFSSVKEEQPLVDKKEAKKKKEEEEKAAPSEMKHATSELSGWDKDIDQDEQIRNALYVEAANKEREAGE